jgi:hypothetical protein
MKNDAYGTNWRDAKYIKIAFKRSGGNEGAIWKTKGQMEGY